MSPKDTGFRAWRQRTVTGAKKPCGCGAAWLVGLAEEVRNRHAKCGGDGSETRSLWRRATILPMGDARLVHLALDSEIALAKTDLSAKLRYVAMYRAQFLPGHVP